MNAYIVEDDESIRFILKRLLKRNFPEIGRVGESETAEGALEELPVFQADVVLVDISLPGMNGIELIQKLKPINKDICILYFFPLLLIWNTTTFQILSAVILVSLLISEMRRSLC